MPNAEKKGSTGTGLVLIKVFLEFGIWNLRIWIIVLPAEFRMQIHTEFRGIPASFTSKNTAEFRMFFKNSVFRRKSKTHFRGHPSITPHSSLLWFKLFDFCRYATDANYI
jgi:hypothetical protein